MEVFKKILGYISFKKQEEGNPGNFNLRAMHGINKISILMFLAAVIYLVVRAMLR
ncbi:MAG: DUF6728 family protein [Bacteroidota bacterium]